MKIIIVLFVSCILSVQVAAAAPAAGTGEHSTPASVEERVREYFKSVPVMIDIARCESKFRHYADSGSVLRGGIDGGMIGVFQFFEAVHAEGAAALGHDLNTLEGSLAYAKHVYDTQGTTPWNSSRYCWNTAVDSSVPAETNRAVLLKKIELLTQLIALLQQLAIHQANRVWHTSPLKGNG